MSIPPSWIEQQWRDVRGNAKWDVIKWTWRVVLTMIAPSSYVVIQKLRQLSWSWYEFAFLFFASLFVMLVSAPLRRREIEIEVQKCLGKTPRSSHTWDAVADFSINANPHGPWSYGWSNDMLGSQFERHLGKQDNDSLGMPRWNSPKIDDLSVGCNQTGNPIRGYSYTVPPHTLHMHPGKGGQHDIVRWTCPKRGTYLIGGSFSGLDDQTTIADSDVNVVINSKTSLFRSAPVLRGKGTCESFTFMGIALNAEDTVDFLVGVGPSGSHGADSTGLKAEIIQQ
jgi:hypothetical protein